MGIGGGGGGGGGGGSGGEPGTAAAATTTTEAGRGPDRQRPMAAPARPDHDADHDDEATPTDTVESASDHEADPLDPSPELTHPPKRKGGRKPIYATSEERKQRNRQAQAAFRERRTEYIKQLEATIKQNEDSLSTLQQSHRSAADECLMLRYKNSLLERILLEKGIDVQSELQMKTGSPLGLQHPAANMPSIPTTQTALQRTAVQRHHARRSGQSLLPRIAPGQSNPEGSFQASPQGHPTPSSHASSPSNTSTRSPMAVYQGMVTTPTSTPQGQQVQFPQMTQQSPNPPGFYQPQQHTSTSTPRNAGHPGMTRLRSAASVGSNQSAGSHGSHSQPSGNAGSSASAYYPSPFQKHIDQLEQEYDAQESQSILDPPEFDDNLGAQQSIHMHENYQQSFEQQRPRIDNTYTGAASVRISSGSPSQQALPQAQFDSTKFSPPNPRIPSTGFPSNIGAMAAPAAFNAMDIDPNDPMLNADPFGLSASMHYPTPYSFDPPHQQ